MYKLVAIGGTFDHLHKGHRRILREAFRISEKVFIGLTSDQYIQEKFSIFNFQFSNNFQIQKYQIREKELREFLQKKGFWDKAKIVKIDDVYGGADRNPDLETIVVTRETVAGTRMINERRKKMGLKLLKIVTIPFVLAEDKKRISSSRIRSGEINREGRLYRRIFNFQFSIFKNQKSKTNNKEKFIISEKLRRELKKPLGKLIKGDPENLTEVGPELKQNIHKLQKGTSSHLITVGDEVTKLVNQVNLKPDLALVDFRVGRKKKYKNYGELGFKIEAKLGQTSLWKVSICRNPAGMITKRMVEMIDLSMKGMVREGKGFIIRVIGEEDLAALPAILVAPLGSVVLYGQPGEGVVVVEVTEKNKEDILRMVERD